MRLNLSLCLCFIFLTPAAFAVGVDPVDGVLDAMRTELVRAKAQLKLEDHLAPYYIGYRVVESHTANVVARFGAVYEDDEGRSRHATADVRVGSYAFDSSPTAEDENLFDEPSGFSPSRATATTMSPAALRATLWLLTDEAYKTGLSTHLKKRAREVMKVSEAHIDSFSQETPVTFRELGHPLDVQRPAWRALTARLSDRFRKAEGVLDATVRIGADRQRTYLINSEGTEVVRDEQLYAVAIDAVAQAPDGMLIEQGRTFYGRRLSELPDEAALAAAVDTCIANLAALSKAPLVDPYTGPAILMPKATGVFFHETVGHRLEGDRQNDENEGGTFKGQIGASILPDFIDIFDDPTLETFNGQPLNGYYTHDDQGIASERVALVEKGVLKTFLTSRTPIEGVSKSNGHGRAQSVRRPIARMGNLIITGRAPVSAARLKEMLIEEVRAQGKPYGLMIRDIIGGSTNTSNYGYQAFKGIPRMVYRVDAKTGEETLVRGVEMVGTPLTVVSKIVATSDEMGVFNGFCGAESGYVPVSAIAPAALFREIELQRSQRDKQRAPILSPPWAAATK